MLSQHFWLMMIHISHGRWATICGTMVTCLCSQKCFLSYQLELHGPYHKHGTHPLFTSWVVFGDMFRGLGVFHIDEMLFGFHQPNAFLFFLLFSFISFLRSNEVD